MYLLSSPASPFARVCRVTLLDLGLSEVEVRDVTANPMGGDAALNAANPSGKIPALVREEGPAIYDSRVITQFLNAHAGGALYPEVSKWNVLSLEANANAIMEAAVGIVYEKRLRPEALQYQPWLEAQWVKVTRSLDALEARSMPLLQGPVTAAQIAIGCALGYLDFRHSDKDWRPSRPALTAWAETFAARPAMVATVPG
ncbi:glutathione S-transferase [Jannaschia pagri]|uniref:Glutathione S-transferase n=1 Tax=Jannaschia pagri TaxID=2829797 RepID=A0ABQ4NPP9_9RHOB|nr:MULTISPECIES: glutathione S-transferase family protein [unclassified Jannaschia]GIT92763.1 glutathione S-transferase [Jannaschia sp. AI_61]GIT96377.1 glutathione S-transferase [Jannaschia sp. AI_62]